MTERKNKMPVFKFRTYEEAEKLSGIFTLTKPISCVLPDSLNLHKRLILFIILVAFSNTEALRMPTDRVRNGCQNIV